MRQPKEYFLSASLLKDALGLKCLSYWWAMHDYGIQVLLNGYMVYHRSSSMGIFSLYDSDGVDQTHSVRNIAGSLEIKKNITAQALTMLLKYLGHIDPHTERTICKLTNYDLQDKELHPQDYLVVDA